MCHSHKMIEILYCLLFLIALIDWTFPRSDFSMPEPSVSMPGPSAPVNSTVPDFPVLPDIPDLPSIPTHSIGRSSVTSDEFDFDDLTKRFEELKKRK